MRVLKENTLAIVVDIQERLFPHIDQYQELEKNINILIDGLQALGIPMLVSEQYKKGLGESIDSIVNKIKNYPAIEKTSFSCCDDQDFSEKLNASDKKSVILFGIESHICVLQTALDLKDKGFEPVVIEDCVGSRNPENKRIAISRLLQEDVTISSCESILFELCRYAGNDTFKTISKLVK